jgi:hypothetical protein
MNPSRFSARQALPRPGQPLRGDCIPIRRRIRPGQPGVLAGDEQTQWFLIMILPLLFWRMLRVFGKPLRQKLEEIAA